MIERCQGFSDKSEAEPLIEAHIQVGPISVILGVH